MNKAENNTKYLIKTTSVFYRNLNVLKKFLNCVLSNFIYIKILYFILIANLK